MEEVAPVCGLFLIKNMGEDLYYTSPSSYGYDETKQPRLNKYW